MGSNNKYLKSKDRMILEYVHGEGRPKYRKYEELDADTGRVDGKEVLREAETKDGGRQRWRRQWGEAGSMEDGIWHYRHR